VEQQLLPTWIRCSRYLIICICIPAHHPALYHLHHHTPLLSCSCFLPLLRCLHPPLPPFLQVGGPHLEYDDYAKAKVALDSAKAAMSTLSEENRILAERLAAAEKEKKALLDRVRA
jgi:hypothetical protein